MRRGEVDVVLVGADRVAANGDTANKVGTYPLAVLAARHGIPFFVCAPTSSIDLDDAGRRGDRDRGAPGRRGADDPRRRRSRRPGTDVRNPAFDVTPAELISGIVTEEGVVARAVRTGLAGAVARRRRAGRRRDRRSRRLRPRTRRRAADAAPDRRGRRLMASVAIDRPPDPRARDPGDHRPRPAPRSSSRRTACFAAYALCDLEDREFGRTRWGARVRRRPARRARPRVLRA